MIVIDASAFSNLILLRPSALELQRRLFSEPTLHAPHLLDIEVAHVIRRYTLHRLIDARRAAEALDDLASFPILRHAHTPLLPRIWEMRTSLTAHDAAYVALAEALNATLITADRRIALAPGHRALVEVFDN